MSRTASNAMLAILINATKWPLTPLLNFNVTTGMPCFWSKVFNMAKEVIKDGAY